MSIAARVRGGAAWLAAARISINVLATLSTIVLARLLTPSDFGVVAVASSILAITTTVTDLSLSNGLIRIPAPQEAHFATVFTLNLIRATLLGLLLCALAPLLASVYSDHRLAGALIIVAVTTFIGGLQNPKLIEFTRQLNFRAEFLTTLTDKATGVVLSIVLAAIFRSYWCLVVGPMIGKATAVLLSYAQKRYKPKLSLIKARELLTFSIWLSLSQVIVAVAMRLDELILGLLVGKATLGAYSFADRLCVALVREISEPLSKTLLPSFSQMVDDRQRLIRAYLRAQSVLAAAAIPLGAVFALVADSFVRCFAGDRWLEAALVIKFAAPAVAIQSLASQVQPLALAVNAPHLLFRRETQYMMLRVPLVYAALATFGLPGFLLARCVVGVAGTVLNMMIIRSLLLIQIRQQIWANWRTLAATLTMSVAVLMAKPVLANALPEKHWAQLFGLAFTGAACYVAALGALWVGTGRPNGPETDFMHLFRTIGSTFKRKLGRETA